MDHLTSLGKLARHSSISSGTSPREPGPNLYRMTQRCYQPATGRFTQLDPNPQEMLSANRLAYAGCNPTNSWTLKGWKLAVPAIGEAP